MANAVVFLQLSIPAQMLRCSKMDVICPLKVVRSYVNYKNEIGT